MRACSVGGTSEHKEGRAFDWGGLNAARAADRDRVKRFTTWLFKTDSTATATPWRGGSASST